jgi:ribonuclease HII
VVAAAVILGEWRHPEINDSKKLSAKKREALYAEICLHAHAWAAGIVDAETIDQINILQASRLAMKHALAGLSPAPDAVLVDALTLDIPQPQEALTRGDSVSLSIAAASIVAKVTRDRMMADFEAQFPGYGFAQHKGYGTRMHLEALQKLGPIALHRKTFTPLHKWVQ